VGAAGVELDRLFGNGLILKNARKSEARESLESLEILVRPPNCPQHNGYKRLHVATGTTPMGRRVMPKYSTSYAARESEKRSLKVFGEVSIGGALALASARSEAIHEILSKRMRDRVRRRGPMGQTTTGSTSRHSTIGNVSSRRSVAAKIPAFIPSLRIAPSPASNGSRLKRRPSGATLRAMRLLLGSRPCLVHSRIVALSRGSAHTAFYPPSSPSVAAS
jgi:hypothetical protein